MILKVYDTFQEWEVKYEGRKEGRWEMFLRNVTRNDRIHSFEWEIYWNFEAAVMADCLDSLDPFPNHRLISINHSYELCLSRNFLLVPRMTRELFIEALRIRNNICRKIA